MRRALLLMRRNSLRNLYVWIPFFFLLHFSTFFFFWLVITVRTIGITDSLIGLANLFFSSVTAMLSWSTVPIVTVPTPRLFYL